MIRLERDVQAAIVSFLRIFRDEIDVWRQNRGASTKTYKGKTRHIRYGVPGAADLTGVLGDGRRVEIEVKRPGEKPSPDQLRYLERINRMNGVGVWGDSVGIVVERLRERGVKLPRYP